MNSIVVLMVIAMFGRCVNSDYESYDSDEGPTYDKNLKHECRCYYPSINLNYCSGWICEIRIIQEQCLSHNHQLKLSD